MKHPLIEESKLASNNGAKLDIYARKALIHMLSMWYSASEIVLKIKEMFGIEITSGTVSHYMYDEKYQPLIERNRADYERQLSKEIFSSFRNRLRELSSLYQDARLHKDPNKPLQVMTEINRMFEKKTESVINQNISLHQVNFHLENLSDEELREKLAENGRLLESLRRKHGVEKNQLIES